MVLTYGFNKTVIFRVIRIEVITQTIALDDVSYRERIQNIQNRTKHRSLRHSNVLIPNRRKSIIDCNKLFLMGCRDGAAVRALASHLCGPSSIPRLGVICGLSLLVLYSAPRGFLRVLRFLLSSKTDI